MKSERRYRAYNIPLEILLGEFPIDGYESNRRIVGGIPKDAKFVGAFSDNASMCVMFVFEHESFDLVEMGASIPFGYLTIHTKEEDADPA
jgi:hypothetical protein